MATEILMPALSPTMEEGTLAKWLVKEGDSVKSGDLLAEIETDKATMEFEAVDEGIIAKILVDEGTQGVKVNSIIAIIVEDGEDASDLSSSAPAAPVAGGVAGGVAAPEAVAPAPSSPPAPQASKASTPRSNGSASKGSDQRIFASPLARRIAKDKGLDLSQIAGTGPKGRIVKADVEAPSAMAASQPTNAGSSDVRTLPATVSAEAVAAMYQDRSFEEVPLDSMRKIIAQRLSEAKQTIPHFYLRRDIKLDALLQMRSKINKQLEARGKKLSVNDFIIKAVALALQEVPEANAVWAGDRVLQMQASDVAVAVAIEGGLFTPVLQDSDQKSLTSLSDEMKDLATRARNRKLAPHEYQGGSFAISNLGMFGIDNFDAIVNPPHAGILAVGAGVKKPIVDEDGAVSVATVMSVTMSVDHRVIDGAVGARLLNAIVGNLENPLVMLV